MALTRMWKSCGKRCWSAALAPRSEPLINRFAQKQQWQFVLACGVAGHWLHGNQAAFASVSQEAPKQCGLSPPLSLPICGHQFVHQMWCSPTKKPAVGQARGWGSFKRIAHKTLDPVLCRTKQLSQGESCLNPHNARCDVRLN